jgi:hypothetical protein
MKDLRSARLDASIDESYDQKFRISNFSKPIKKLIIVQNIKICKKSMLNSDFTKSKTPKYAFLVRKNIKE